MSTNGHRREGGSSSHAVSGSVEIRKIATQKSEAGSWETRCQVSGTGTRPGVEMGG